jgi:hypothetical protein
VPAALLLVNNGTETAWFQRALGVAAAVCFPAGRVRFRFASGESGPPYRGRPSCISAGMRRPLWRRSEGSAR